MRLRPFRERCWLRSPRRRRAIGIHYMTGETYFVAVSRAQPRSLAPTLSPDADRCCHQGDCVATGGVWDDRATCPHTTAQAGTSATIGEDRKLYGTYL